ncbi:MAG TPA: transposase [Noviherbaspirillum sp.]|uniref:REP-associated tyrosine transposase n=1 Tax=Noviherbaspirillum sp. TaxID=1926288 RepID=UPI002D718A62|nr:transposase [Noviherbaspirillum sp.]HYD94256.1 transposase [Noviherbaspirillum sp.]
MARLPRLVVPNQPHHIIQTGNDRQTIFRDADDHAAFLVWLRQAAKQSRVAIHAYVLMPDHIHLLASPAEAGGLGQMMQWMGRQYVPYFNGKYQRTGTLWQGRYKATVIESDRYFLMCSRYIETNPVRAGLVALPEEYPWSSIGHHLGIKHDAVITDHSVFWALGNTPFDREASYRAVLDQELGEREVQALTEATLKGWPLGSEQFKARLAKLSNRRVEPARRGRPPKRTAESERSSTSS